MVNEGQLASDVERCGWCREDITGRMYHTCSQENERWFDGV